MRAVSIYVCSAAGTQSQLTLSLIVLLPPAYVEHGPPRHIQYIHVLALVGCIPVVGNGAASWAHTPVEGI